MMMKLDMKRAYGRLKWNFVIRVLRALGFNEKFQHLIYSCISLVTFALLLNESVPGNIRPGR